MSRCPSSDPCGACLQHFHYESPHYGIGNKIFEPRFRCSNESEKTIEYWQRLGGLLGYSVPEQRKAAYKIAGLLSEHYAIKFPPQDLRQTG